MTVHRRTLRIRDDLHHSYEDVYTPEVLAALEELSEMGPEAREILEERWGEKRSKLLRQLRSRAAAHEAAARREGGKAA